MEGLPSLVEALSRKLAAENRLDLSHSRVVVTAGGNMAFINAVLAVADPGDEVILPTPYYFNHEMAVAIAGAGRCWCRRTRGTSSGRTRSATRSRRGRGRW